MSWLAAARKRVLEMLASSASPLARPSAALSRVSSSVRSLTRRSRVSLARSSASAASTLGVMSVKVVTRPPSGMWLARISTTRPRSAKRSLDRLAAREVARDAVAHEVVDPAGAERAAASALWRRISSSPTPTRVERGRQVEDLAELPVPADQLQVLVEHRDALAHVVERGLQDLAVVLDRRVGVVEQLQRRLGRDRALAQQQRQHEPRGGRADRRGEQMLGVAQQMDVGLVLADRG